MARVPTAFISYSWDSDAHKEWVKALAARLRGDGVDVTLDQWHLVPGDQMPAFMERSVRESDYVLIVCTPRYKDRSDNRTGGVGYEGDIITGAVLTQGNERKFIPLLREGEWKEAAPTWLAGKYHLDFRGTPYAQGSYADDLLTTLLGTRPQAPPVGKRPVTAAPVAAEETRPTAAAAEFEPIKISGVIVDQVGSPRGDGTAGSALYRVPFRLTHRPPPEWATLFVQAWDRPSSFSSMHRPRIASVVGDTVVLNGTTVEEVELYHRETLILAARQANERYQVLLEQRRQEQERQREQLELHRKAVTDSAARIKFE